MSTPTKTSEADRPVELAVFAPAPQLTITIERLSDGGDEVHVHAGGQGVWIARMAETLGAHVRICGAFGGEGGPILIQLLRDEGLEVRAATMAAGNPVYVHDRRSGSREEIASQKPQTLGRHELDDLYGIVLGTAADADVAAIGGPVGTEEVPSGFYSRLTADLAELGTPVVADLSGAPMHAALEGGLTVLKVSHSDLLRDGDAEGDDDRSLIAAMEALHEAGAKNVILTRGGDPSLILVGGTVKAVHAPSLSEVDHRGAGDALTAGVATALARGAMFEDAVRLGAAAGTSTVARHGLASAREDLIHTVARHIEIRAHESSAAS